MDNNMKRVGIKTVVHTYGILELADVSTTYYGSITKRGDEVELTNSPRPSGFSNFRCGGEVEIPLELNYYKNAQSLKAYFTEKYPKPWKAFALEFVGFNKESHGGLFVYGIEVKEKEETDKDSVVKEWNEIHCLKEFLRLREKIKVIRQLHEGNLLQAFSDEAQWQLEEAIKE